VGIVPNPAVSRLSRNETNPFRIATPLDCNTVLADSFSKMKSTKTPNLRKAGLVCLDWHMLIL
jgi:hypothetical protein